jgi:redox-sensing transcriptional repressor
MAAEGRVTVSSGDLARECGINAAQLRKDLSAFGSFGKRGLGYPVAELVPRLKEILGLTRTWRVALVGAGRIGQALFEFPAFRGRGFHILAIVDADPAKVGTHWGDIEIEADDDLETVIARESIDLVVLAVPAAVARGLARRSVGAGARGILNFAPIRLDLPDDVPVNHVNMGLELEALAFALGGAPTDA